MRLLNRKNKVILFQILFWTLIICSINLFFLASPWKNSMVTRNFTALAGMTFIIIVNVHYLIPRYFVRKQYDVYGGLLLSLIVIFVGVSAYFEFGFTSTEFSVFADRVRDLADEMQLDPLPPIPVNSQFPIVFLKTILMTIAAAISTVFESIEINREQEKVANQIRNEQLETEMKFLKSQINPHFLFNVLNNIYGLALAKSDQTPEVVMRLSEMLRFMLYDSVKKTVPLKKEMDYIKNYIAIQQLKDKTPLCIDTQFAGANESTHIAPMLLIPFVENAFKHSKIEDSRSGWIKMKLNGSPGEVDFSIQNSLPPMNFTKDKTGGIGLKNVSRRLELQYPTQHSLKIEKGKEEFRVSLNLKTK